MRRIPRPSRAFDPSSTLQLPLRPRLPSSSCPFAQSPTSAAAFSTTAPHAFLLPSQKQDKKKHQQFVRRWQKRLLGDSEPIGAHVDPYDPTSPVRIAPEDQGEYEEVLEEDSKRQLAEGPHYVPAQEAPGARPGLSLQRVGGPQWSDLRRETARAKDFELFTKRTYTPLTLGMAGGIEDLTGTPYTLRDDNLMMAQTVHEVTGKPYTHYDFGLHKKATKQQEIRSRFDRAVVEVYTLKEAGLPLDLSSSPNRGVYNRPKWVSSIRIGRTESGDAALEYPKFKSAQDLVRIMQEAPDWEASLAEEEDVLLEDAEDLLDPVLPQEPIPTMDPATPAFKRAAMVKQDLEKKPFDFMSNRPVPRKAPVTTPEIPVEAPMEEVIVQEVVDVEVEEPVQSVPSTPRVNLEQLTSTVTASQSTISELRKAVLAHRAQQSSSVSQEADTKWRSISIADPAIKFALFKRLYQLTGLHISDPQLNSTQTLGDLYSHLCTVSKPAPAKLFSAIHVEGQKVRERAKQFPIIAAENSTSSTRRQRADLGDLITLGNVNVRRHKASEQEKWRSTGFAKVVSGAVRKRGLRMNMRKSGAKGSQDAKYALQGETAPHEVVTRLARYTRKQMEDAA